MQNDRNSPDILRLAVGIAQNVRHTARAAVEISSKTNDKPPTKFLASSTILDPDTPEIRATRGSRGVVRKTSSGIFILDELIEARRLQEAQTYVQNQNLGNEFKGMAERMQQEVSESKSFKSAISVDEIMAYDNYREMVNQSNGLAIIIQKAAEHIGVELTDTDMKIAEQVNSVVRALTDYWRVSDKDILTGSNLVLRYAIEHLNVSIKDVRTAKRETVNNWRQSFLENVIFPELDLALGVINQNRQEFVGNYSWHILRRFTKIVFGKDAAKFEWHPIES